MTQNDTPRWLTDIAPQSRPCQTLRSQTDALKKAASAYRAEIAALKRRTEALERALRRLTKAYSEVAPLREGVASPESLRFTAKGLVLQRRRLGLSAHQCGLLVGAAGQSVYNWEAGTARPRAKLVPAICSS